SNSSCARLTTAYWNPNPCRLSCSEMVLERQLSSDESSGISWILTEQRNFEHNLIAPRSERRRQETGRVKKPFTCPHSRSERFNSRPHSSQGASERCRSETPRFPSRLPA